MNPPVQLGTPSSRTSTISSSDPHTPANNTSPSKSVAGLKELKNADTVGQMMTLNHLMHNDRAAFDSYPDFKEKVKRIVLAKRDSTMKLGSHRKFEVYLDCYERMNEATFLRKIFPLLMKDGYHLVKERDDFTDAEKKQLKQEQMIYRDFLMEEGIVETTDREFLKTLVPSSCNQDSEIAIAKLLAKSTGMTNPRPDFTFGVKRDRFPPLHNVPLPEGIAALLGIAPGMHHAFLIVEGKPDAGSHAEAENQARRGGATLVHAERILRDILGEVADTAGPDEKCFVYSATLTPKVVEVWVHWYEGPNPGYYHMNRIASHTLNEEKNREDIRMELHNIMEWGGSTRFTEKKDLHDSIHTYVRREHKKRLTEAAQKAADKTAEKATKKIKGSPQKKRRHNDSSEE